MKNIWLILSTSMLGIICLSVYAAQTRDYEQNHHQMDELVSSKAHLKTQDYSCIYQHRTNSVACYPITDRKNPHSYHDVYTSCRINEKPGSELIGVYKNPHYIKHTDKTELPYCSVWQFSHDHAPDSRSGHLSEVTHRN